MELATNSFNKGLQMDTHPMVLGNDSLTDCLNGTLVTMNGNEIILLNDMGNRRVELAYLPAGYEPVGIKEYGGIIYVACYNPITGKSLIGSFPSPEKRMDDIDDGKLSVSINLFEDLNSLIEEKTFQDIFGENLSESEEKFLFINNFLKLYTYSNSYPLHIGDKFCLYGDIKGFFIKKDDLYVIPLVSNFFNFFGGLMIPYSPKNKLFNLEVGILNSENTFIDLTNHLVRWAFNGDYIDTKNYSEEYIKNIGSFIKSTENENLFETKSDKEFNISRNSNENLKNTYLYKLSGPLCIRETVNSLLSFDVSIEIDFDKNNSSEVFVGNEDSIGIIEVEPVLGTTFSQKYSTDLTEFSEGNFDCFDLIINNNKEIPYKITKNILHSYDPETNLYTLKQTRIYYIKVDYLENSSNDFECFIAPKLINNNGIPFGGVNKSYSDISGGNLKLYITYTTIYNSPDNIPNVNKVHYTNDGYNSMEDILEAYSSLNKPIYLENLCLHIKYNLNMINSGTLQIYDWRTYCRINSNKELENLELSYSLVSYPKPFESYLSLKLLLLDSEWKSSEIKLSKGDFINSINNRGLNGVEILEFIENIYELNEDENLNLYPSNIIIKNIHSSLFNISSGTVIFTPQDGIEISRVYDVELIWDSVNTLTLETTFKKLEVGLEESKYWIMTTTLFNDSYIRGSSKYIDNYVNPSVSIYKDIKSNLLKIVPNISSDINIIEDDIIETSEEGNIFSGHIDYEKLEDLNINYVFSDPSNRPNSYTRSHKNTFSVETTKSTKLNIIPNISIDRTKYPESLISSNTTQLLSVNISSVDIKFSDYTINNSNLNIYNKDNIVENSLITLSEFFTSGNIVTLNYKIKEILNFKGMFPENAQLINPYLPFSWAFSDNINEYSLTTSPAMSSLKDSSTGGRMWWKPRFINAGEHDGVNIYITLGIDGYSGEHPMSEVPDDMGEILGRMEWPAGGLVINLPDNTFINNNSTRRPLLVYAPFGNGEEYSPFHHLMLYVSGDSDATYYRCTRTEYTGFVIMKNINNGRANKKLLLFNGDLNTRLRSVLSDPENRYPYEHCHDVTEIDSLEETINILFGSNIENIYIKSMEQNSILLNIEEFMRSELENNIKYCNYYYPDLSQSTYPIIPRDSLNKTNINISFSVSPTNLNENITIKEYSRIQQFELLEGISFKVSQKDSIKISNIFLDTIDKIENGIELFNNVLIKPFYKNISEKIFSGFILNHRVLNELNNMVEIKDEDNYYINSTTSDGTNKYLSKKYSESSLGWKIGYNSSNRPTFFSTKDVGGAPTIGGFIPIYVGFDKTSQGDNTSYEYDTYYSKESAIGNVVSEEVIRNGGNTIYTNQGNLLYRYLPSFIYF